MPLAGHDNTIRHMTASRTISTPMPLAGHDRLNHQTLVMELISTPMPLAGHDSQKYSFRLGQIYFYSHAPRGA